jgi:hypothetical protein
MFRLRKRRVATGLAFAIMLLCAVLPVLTDAIARAEDPDLPVNLHLTWQQNNMSSTITLTWQTINSSPEDVVLYDNVSRNGDPMLYKHSVNATTHTYAGASGYIHDAKLTGSESDSTYYFICGTQTGGYSTERSVKTAPANPTSLRFVVGGDCRTNWTERDIISRTMREFNPSFVLLAGDLVADGYNQTEWDNFLESLQSYWIANNSLTIPIVPCLGNHENNATNYFEQFALPSNEQWYSLDWGRLAHITVLDSEADPAADQLVWLENDLASHQNSTWKFVLFHRPPFSSSSHGSWIEGRQYWCPLFDRYHVDIVFSGHDHDYERSKPINYTASEISPQDSYSDGTMYVVSGGWGAPLSSSGTNWWTAYSLGTYNFLVVDIFANGTMSVRAENDSGLMFDEVPQKTPIIIEFSPIVVLPLFIILVLVAAVMQRFKKRGL